jgi:hypothetical protein
MLNSFTLMLNTSLQRQRAMLVMLDSMLLGFFWILCCGCMFGMWKLCLGCRQLYVQQIIQELNPCPLLACTNWTVCVEYYVQQAVQERNPCPLLVFTNWTVCVEYLTDVTGRDMKLHFRPSPG